MTFENFSVIDSDFDGVCNSCKENGVKSSIVVRLIGTEGGALQTVIGISAQMNDESAVEKVNREEGLKTSQL